MKIIIDECVPSIVKRGLPSYNIVTVQEMGWAGIQNGELLSFFFRDSRARSSQRLAAAESEPSELGTVVTGSHRSKASSETARLLLNFSWVSLPLSEQR